MMVDWEHRPRLEAVFDHSEVHEVRPPGFYPRVGMPGLDRAEVDDRPAPGTSATGLSTT
jgi:hypothetical protein